MPRVRCSTKKGSSSLSTQQNSMKHSYCLWHQAGPTSFKKKCVSPGYKLSTYKVCSTAREALNRLRLKEHHIPVLACHFDKPEMYADFGFKLLRAKRGDVRKCARDDNAQAMVKALKGWLDMDPLQATFKQFVKIILNIEEDKNTVHQLLDVIRTLSVKCENNNCQWKGELGDLETHLEVCDYAAVSSQCESSSSEEKKFPKGSVPEHLGPNHDRRSYLERDCTQASTTRVIIPCLNYPCTEKFPPKDLLYHRSVCDYEPVACKHAELGCEERPLRKDLKIHEEDDQFHIQILTETVLEMRDKVANTQVFEMTDFQDYKETGEVFQSPPFYTSRRGYKMCVRVYASGGGCGEGTHISVAVFLMKGDNDDSLTPFTGTVTLEVLNQIENKNHQKATITFSADHEASKRVLDGRNELGRGHDFHLDLDYQPDRNCQYLEYDTLVFRVSVQATDYKPWLEPTM